MDKLIICAGEGRRIKEAIVPFKYLKVKTLFGKKKKKLDGYFLKIFLKKNQWKENTGIKF